MTGSESELSSVDGTSGEDVRGQNGSISMTKTGVDDKLRR